MTPSEIDALDDDTAIALALLAGCEPWHNDGDWFQSEHEDEYTSQFDHWINRERHTEFCGCKSKPELCRWWLKWKLTTEVTA